MQRRHISKVPQQLTSWSVFPHKHSKQSCYDNLFHAVDFYLKDHSNQWRHLGRDESPPYRGFNHDAFKGKKIDLKAVVTDQLGKTVVLEQKVEKLGPPPFVIIHYENGNQRQQGFHVYDDGLTVLPSSLQEGTYQFQWPEGKRQALLVFESEGKDGSRLDLPIFLDAKKDILPAGKQEGARNVARIFINNLHQIASKKNFSKSHEKPEVLKGSAESPLGKTEVFLRGGMNRWEAVDQMRYAGASRYEVDVSLKPGMVEFKFGDEQWNREANFGAPIKNNGLYKSGGSKNLTVNVPEAGKYSFQLFCFRSGAFNFFKVSRLSH